MIKFVQQENKPDWYIDDRWLRVVMIPIIGFITAFVFFGEELTNDWGSNLYHFITSIIYTTVYFHGCRFILFTMKRRMPNPSQIKKRLIIQSIMGVVFVVFVSVVPDFCFEKLLNLPYDSPPQILSITLVLLYFFAFQALYEGIFYFNQYKISAQRAEQLEIKNTRSQLAALKNQVNPHFLFNSLNTLASIIPDDPKIAVRFVEKLSKVYRYILEIRDRETITLKEEIDHVNAYLFLLHTRFENNLTARIELPESLHEFEVVPLGIQMLVENAVKHNIISRKNPLTIEIKPAGEDAIMVRNSLQPKHQIEGSTKVGLQNIRDRYELLSQKKVDVIVSERYFTVILPLIRIQSHIPSQHISL